MRIALDLAALVEGEPGRVRPQMRLSIGSPTPVSQWLSPPR
jgi:hypothetical protein